MCEQFKITTQYRTSKKKGPIIYPHNITLRIVDLNERVCIAVPQHKDTINICLQN
jgi:hypothetical protein